MTSADNQPAVSPPSPSRFQFSLRTLLLLFVVLASSMGVFGPAGIVVFAIVVGLAICVNLVETFWSLTNLVLVVFGLMCLIALLLPAVGSAREAARRAQCVNNLKQIALALHNYHAANGCFPPAYIADKNGKPMHSWRVLILRYLLSDQLYKTYDFTEPWDGPNNKKLLASWPSMYACPSDPDARAPGADQTSYVAVVGPRAAWAGAKSRKLGPVDFAGGTSNTIMVVEVADSGIPWTEPRDLSLDASGGAETKLPALTVSSKHNRRESFFFIYDQSPSANVAMADGSVLYLRPGSFSTEDLPKLLQIGGYNEEQLDAQAALCHEQWHLNWPNIAALVVWFLSVGMLLRVAVRSRRPLSVPPPPAVC